MFSLKRFESKTNYQLREYEMSNAIYRLNYYIFVNLQDLSIIIYLLLLFFFLPCIEENNALFFCLNLISSGVNLKWSFITSFSIYKSSLLDFIASLINSSLSSCFAHCKFSL